jgi:hypothetical protein
VKEANPSYTTTTLTASATVKKNAVGVIEAEEEG